MDGFYFPRQNPIFEKKNKAIIHVHVAQGFVGFEVGNRIEPLC